MKGKNWLMASLMCLSLPANSASQFKPIEVRDAELAQLRGRYVLPDRVVYFGITMSSVWQNSAGQAVGAVVSLLFDGKAEPSLHISYIDQSGNGSPVTPGTGQITGGAGLNNVQGVVQSVRSAGDFNDAQNNLSITISQADTTAPAATGQASDGSGQFSNAAGDVQVTSNAAGLKVALQAGGQGYAQQQIGGGSISQQASISGSLNNVRNLATLNLALRDRPLNTQLANCTWEQLRALRPTGY